MIFIPLHTTDRGHRKKPASTNKIVKGDAHWRDDHKGMLGWDIDSKAVTPLNLSPHPLERLREVLGWLHPPRKRLALSK